MAAQPEPKFVLVDDKDRVAKYSGRKVMTEGAKPVMFISWTHDLQRAIVSTETNWRKLRNRLEGHQELPYCEYHEVVTRLHFKEDLEEVTLD